jgi:hypothetical protein
MGQQLVFICHAAEEKTEHLVCSFGGLFACLETNQQTCNDGHVDLNLDAVFRMARQVLTTKNAFEPPKK